MTPSEWDHSIDPEALLQLPNPARTRRKDRLFALACCHRVIHLINSPLVAEALRQEEHLIENGNARCSRELFEKIVQQASRAQGIKDPLQTARLMAYWTVQAALSPEPGPFSGPCTAAKAACNAVAEEALSWSWNRSAIVWEEAWEQERATQADLVREIYPNPEAPVIRGSCDLPLTERIIYFAQTMASTGCYELFEPLASALERAGCTGAVLDHCRNGHSHTKGCWVIDLILEKG